MSRQCTVTGKKPMAGNSVSHSKRSHRRRRLPNTQVRRIWIPSLQSFKRLSLSARALKTIDRIGADAVWARLLAQTSRTT